MFDSLSFIEYQNSISDCPFSKEFLSCKTLKIGLIFGLEKLQNHKLF
jgi:hypothetical protein